MKYIYLHGFLSGPSSVKGEFLFRHFAESHLELIRPDLNGDNFERMTITSQLNIINGVIDRAEGEVVLIGSSLGGYLAALVAGNRPEVQKLVLLAPAFDFISRYVDRLTEKQLQEWKDTGFIRLYQYHYKTHRKLRYQIVEDARLYEDHQFILHIPLFIIHGLRDESVPYQVSIDFLQDNLQGEMLLLPADHGMLDKLEVIWKYLRIFLGLPDTRA
jgi:pimeloyl-ACP methyl ester carboxylesterase